MSNSITIQLQLSFDVPVLNPLLLLQNINLALVDATEGRGLAPAHHPDCPFDEEGNTEEAGVTEYLKLTVGNHCLKTRLDANNTTTKIQSQDLTSIHLTTEPEMKYLLIEINERNGEKEYTARCLAQCSNDQNNNLVADAIALNWYEDCLDENPYDRYSFWFEYGAIAVEVGNVYELPKEHFDLLILYLSDLTPCDTAIAKAIDYKTATKS